MITGARYTEYQRGDVVLVPFQFTDLRRGKVRPAVVIAGSGYLSSQPDLLIAGLTGNIITVTGLYHYILRDWQTAGLHKPSAFKPVLATLEPTLVVHRIGRIVAADMIEIDRRLRAMLEL